MIRHVLIQAIESNDLKKETIRFHLLPPRDVVRQSKRLKWYTSSQSNR
jgi:hypothetical protein